MAPFGGSGVTFPLPESVPLVQAIMIIMEMEAVLFDSPVNRLVRVLSVIAITIFPIFGKPHHCTTPTPPGWMALRPPYEPVGRFASGHCGDVVIVGCRSSDGSQMGAEKAGLRWVSDGEAKSPDPLCSSYIYR
ncbi:hypothetical protein DFH07DRAFT_773658 [Mycena maculata]|uniref:Uncharacterized protein n=1 Tax=Mycena maculata TaxID=230809 RepID=A0AAD7J141_9AGAR|nr:hypothetical protein DFH07DRAFT_773658 [Mycena maculata]